MKFLLLLFVSPLMASFCGNTASMSVMNESLFFKNASFYSLRLGYVYDSVFYSHYKNLETNDRSYFKISSNLAEGALNFYKTFDLFGFAGTSKIELDNQFIAEGKLTFGGGARILFFNNSYCAMGIDGRYLRTRQKIDYILDNGQLIPVLSPVYYTYQEYQGALIFSYKVLPLVPYFGATYLYSDLDPVPSSAMIQVGDDFADASLSSVHNSRKWGLVLGVSIIGDGKINLTLEGRLFSQYAFGSSLSIRF